MQHKRNFMAGLKRSTKHTVSPRVVYSVRYVIDARSHASTSTTRRALIGQRTYRGKSNGKKATRWEERPRRVRSYRRAEERLSQHMPFSRHKLKSGTSRSLLDCLQPHACLLAPAYGRFKFYGRELYLYCTIRPPPILSWLAPILISAG